MKISLLCTAVCLLGFVGGGLMAVATLPQAVTHNGTESNVPVVVLPQPTETTSTSTPSIPTENEANTTSTPEVNEVANQVILEIGEKHTFADGLTVTLREISDSRCHPDVQCIWAGELSPTIMATGGKLGEQTLTVSLGTIRATASSTKYYTFTLVGTTEKSVELKVTGVPTVPKTPVSTIPNKPKTAATAIPKQTAQVISATFTEQLITYLEKETASFRQDQGLKTFVRNNTLARNATSYSLRMLRGNFIAHTDPSGCDLSCRFAKDKFTAQAWGENLAVMEFEDRPSVEDVGAFFMREWEKSAGHRANLLSDKFTDQGIGVAVDSDSIYVTVHFAQP